MKGLYLAAATAAILSTPAHAATMFTFDESNSFVRVTDQRDFCLGCNVSASMANLPSFALDQTADSYSFDFANFLLSPGIGVGRALIEAQLAFRDPFSATAGSAATGNYLRLGGWLTPGLTAGWLAWSNPTQIITASNGTSYSVTFGNISGIGVGGNATSRVTVSLLSSAVPETATWMLMVVGFGVVGCALRHRTRLQYKVYSG